MLAILSASKQIIEIKNQVFVVLIIILTNSNKPELIRIMVIYRYYEDRYLMYEHCNTNETITIQFSY